MLRIPRFLNNRLADDVEVFSFTYRTRSTLQKHMYFCLWRSFLLEAEYNPGQKSFASSSLKPATFRPVAYCLNYYATARNILIFN
jgi:hypothetical protein